MIFECNYKRLGIYIESNAFNSRNVSFCVILDLRKMTSICWQLEDDLIYFVYGRQPQCHQLVMGGGGIPVGLYNNFIFKNAKYRWYNYYYNIIKQYLNLSNLIEITNNNKSYSYNLYYTSSKQYCDSSYS